MAKGGPPTLKGLLKKGKDKFGDSTPAYFDFLEAREEMLMKHQHLISSAVETELNPQPQAVASLLKEDLSVATVSTATHQTASPTPVAAAIATPAASLDTTLSRPIQTPLLKKSESINTKTSIQTSVSAEFKISEGTPEAPTSSAIDFTADATSDIDQSILIQSSEPQAARLKTLKTEYKRSTNGVQDPTPSVDQKTDNGVQTEYKLSVKPTSSQSETEYKRSTNTSTLETKGTLGKSLNGVQTEYKNVEIVKTLNIQNQIVSENTLLNGVQTEYKSEFKSNSNSLSKRSTNGVQDHPNKIEELDLNGVQTEYKSEYEQDIVTEYKESTNGVQQRPYSVDTSQNTPEREYKRSTKRVQTVNQTGNRSEYKQSTNLNYRLMGNQERFVLVTLFEIARQAGSLSTGPIKAALISEKVNIKVTTLKQVLKRICDKGFLIRDKDNSQTGRGGVSAFVIPISLYQQILMDRDNGVQIEYKQSTIRSTIQSTNPSSKLVSNINTNLLETSPERVLPDFVDCDISPLNSFGIYKKHLMDLHNQKRLYTSEQMDQFIWKFSQYCSDPQKVKTVRNFPALFINMAQKLAEGYDPLEGLKTPEQELVLVQIEKSKKALFELRRQKEEAKELEYELWVESMTRSERDELAPPNAIMDSGSELQLRSLRGYFEKTVWRG